MSQSQGNIRIRRTQKLLREALIELIEEQSFDALTVGELTSRALVSRAAFYRNYQDKYDLVEQIFAEAMKTMFGTIANMESTHHPSQVWVKFFEHIAEYDRLYRALLGKKGSPWFVSKMRAALTILIREHEHVPSEHSTLDRPVIAFSDSFVPDVVSAMLVEAITWWLENEKPYTPTDIATRCALLASAVFKEVSAWH